MSKAKAPAGKPKTDEQQVRELAAWLGLNAEQLQRLARRLDIGEKRIQGVRVRSVRDLLRALMRGLAREFDMAELLMREESDKR